AGKVDPGEIRREQRAREWAQAREGDDRGEDQHPENDELDERREAKPPREEQPAPERVRGELDQEQSERGASALPAVRSPDEPGGDRHQRVQHRPHRAEHRARRGPARHFERAVELRCANARDASDQGSREGHEEPADETHDLHRSTLFPGNGYLSKFCAVAKTAGLYNSGVPFAERERFEKIVERAESALERGAESEASASRSSETASKTRA